MTALAPHLITLFLAGDVMTGRGVDQVLPYPGDPVLHESYMKSAVGYVDIAERAHGAIPRPVDYSYVWGDALAEWDRVRPDVRIVNLETSITKSDKHWPGKGIHYRMHPENAGVLAAAGIDCCALANNHVLDWGIRGLTETLETLARAGIAVAGAGVDRIEAIAPAVIEVGGKGRVLVFSYGLPDCGIPPDWAALENRPGINLLKDLSDRTAKRVRSDIAAFGEVGDVVLASIHWGGNWGYEIPAEHIAFAHDLIDSAGVDIIHGHSSHHAKGIEVYHGKPVIYGSGDFLNDYEGIGGYEEFRSDLVLMYFATVDPSTGMLVRLELTPMRIRHFRLSRPSREEITWIENMLTREGKRFGTRVEWTENGPLTVRWN